MRLCLIRHFAPDIESGVCYGQTDLALKIPVQQEVERIDALRERVARFLGTEAPVFTSPSQRCRALASVLSPRAIADSRLREINFGAWEMQTWDAIGPSALDAWANDLAGFRPPGGETGYELQQRALAWLREVVVQHEMAVAVTHAGVMRVLQAHHQRLPGSQWLNLRYEYGELICLDFDDRQINGAPVQ